MSKVWYACYGSNVLFERFRYYIQGGTYPQTGKKYCGCRDKTLPTKSLPIIIPYEMYFGNSSNSWGGSGVAFLETRKPSAALGRAYLITDGQFDDVRRQEGCSSNWYNYEVDLGFYEGDPVKTFTNSVRRNENRPSDAYLRVIIEGMHEMIGSPIIIPNQQGGQPQ